jgi:hypothetical protein
MTVTTESHAWRQLTRMHALLPFALVAQVTAPVDAVVPAVEPVDEPAVARAVLWPGVSLHTRLDDGGAGAGQIALSYRLVDWFAPELLASVGGYTSLAPLEKGAAPSFQLVDRFSIGARFIYPIDGIEPFVWTALHHEHQTELSALQREPIAATFGLSHAGVEHKTGGEVAVGVAIPVVIDRTTTFAMTRVGAVALPSYGAAGVKDEFALFVDVAAGLPLLF